MSRYLFIGDLHCQYSNLEDTKLLFEYIKSIKKEQSVDKIVFLGDVYHTHDVLRVGLACEIQNLFKNLNEKKEDVIALVGNHDFTKPNASEVYNSVRLSIGNYVTVVDRPMTIENFSFVPFMGDNEEFVKVCNELPDSNVLCCHQTFDSAVYENNFTAPGGVDQTRIKQKTIISGHIHKRQVLEGSNTVYYIGTPRQLNANEANDPKYLVIFENDVPTTMFETGPLVKQFISIDINESNQGEVQSLQSTWKEKDDVRIYVTGTEEFYEQTLKSHEHLKNVKFIPNIKKVFNKKIDLESSGSSIDEALYKYVHEVHDMNENLKGEVWKRLQAKIPQLGNKI